MDAGSDAGANLETRCRLYQSITRAQLGAIVVNQFLQGGWLEHLTLCKLVEREFDQFEGRLESSAAAASEVTKELQAEKPAQGTEENRHEALRSSAGGTPEKKSTSSTEDRPSTKPSSSPASAKVTKEKAMTLRTSCVWDTTCNSMKARIYELRFDPSRRSPAEAFEILKSKLTSEPLPANCPYPEDECLLWRQKQDFSWQERYRNGSKQETILSLFLRDGTILSKTLVHERSEHEGDPSDHEERDHFDHSKSHQVSINEGQWEMVGFILRETPFAQAFAYWSRTVRCCWCAPPPENEWDFHESDWGVIYGDGSATRESSLKQLLESQSSRSIDSHFLLSLSEPRLEAWGMNPLHLWFWRS